MTVSASYRTDIPAFYGAWFLRRLRAGYCYTLNPYNQTAAIVPLTPDHVDGFVFWTKFVGPFPAVLSQVAAQGIPFVVHHTLTHYPRALEARVPRVDRAIAAMRSVAAAYGPRVLVWRYDPIVLTSATPPDWHRAQFAALAAATDEVVVSYLQDYPKVRPRLQTRLHTQGWHPLSLRSDAQRALLADLANIAAAHDMRLSLGAQPELGARPPSPRHDASTWPVQRHRPPPDSGAHARHTPRLPLRRVSGRQSL